MRKSFMLAICSLLIFSGLSYGQFVTIVNKKFVVNGNASCPIYFNGANTPWESWNDFGGSYNTTKWAQDMSDLKSKGINAARIWFSCNGDGQPNVATDGTVSAPSAAFWTNCDHLFAQAQVNGVYIMATMMSFDHTKTANNKSTNWRNMMNDTAKIRTYLNNYLIPFVNRYKTNPYLWSIDLCNEIEWDAENTDNWKCSYAVLQRFIGMCCAGLHSSAVARTDGTKVLITLGSAGTKWNGTKMRNGSNGTGWVTNNDGNKWSDAALKAQYNNANAYLDFYSPHFYGWLNEYYYNMFQKSPADYGMDEKPCMVGEMPARDPMPTPAMSQLTAYNNLKTLGWQGHMPWTANITTNLTTEVGSLADFGAAALSFKNSNTTLIVPNCAAVVTCTSPKLGADLSLCGVTGGVTLNSNMTNVTNKTFKWYNGTTQVAGSASTLTGVTTAGTYIVVVDSASGTCISRDTVIVSSTIPTPSLSTTNICSPATVSLNSGINGSVYSFKWYLGTTTIDGATGSTLTNIRTPGTYKVEVSATGCTTQSASVAVTSNLPTPVDGCRGTTGTVVLGVINTASVNFGWYSTVTGGTSLGTGTTFTTPSLLTTTTFYVQDLNTSSTCARLPVVASIDATCSAAVSIDLVQGWNVIGCPIAGSTDLAKALSSIWSQVQTVKSLDAFWSVDNTAALNSLTKVDWGKGYLVKVKNACTLDWIVR